MSYPPLAPSTQAPTPPPSITAASADKSKPKTTRKGRKPSSRISDKTSSQDTPIKKGERLHKRSRSGCFTCRLRRKKCDEGKPVCKACRNLKLKCEYKRPMWWGNNDQRRNHKELIKELIKNTKLNERGISSAARSSAACTYTPPALSHSAPTPETFIDGMVQTRDPSLEPQYPFEHEFSQCHPQDPLDSLTSQLQNPLFESAPFWTAAPYEIDIKTENEVYVNDIPTRRESTTSTFSMFQPTLPHSMLPPLSDDKWSEEEFLEGHSDPFYSGLSDHSPFQFTHAPVHISTIHVEDRDRPLLDHFFEKVVRLIFPILEAKRPGAVRSEVILPAIESNKCYLHCCLSSTGVHLKATQQLSSESIDNEILRHRYQTVSELCKALNEDTNHSDILEATLAMIFFQCAVGRPDDSLPDIPWHQHFQAATSLVHKLDLSRRLIEADQVNVHPPFNMSLSAWIDILGSTMLGQMPQFAHTYRTKLFNGSSSGLCDLMGCEDRIMYLIAEISCLDALKNEGRIDHLGLCGHITTLAKQLDQAEPPAESIADPCADGTFQPRQLVKNMTALFCIAARIYLCSLVPGFQRTQPSTLNLIARAGELLELIPGGPGGFDRSLVWPLLICGSYSVPNSPFRSVLARRMEQLGEQAEFGSFGRMARLLQEVWRAADGVVEDSQLNDASQNDVVAIKTEDGQYQQQSPEHIPMESINGQNTVHWRDVMQKNGWDFLLI
ncbi:Fungal Zn binuclear cluster domain containing protein [Coccidioides posadasii C735 delta SOWgp]|uniref:Fungal Zn binuclear cluster domain containing protein n=1 Tax=Coccidioides posadasii (strain C735) TaxID=222929 RepID=C5PJ09_COCP7|nr:Fungal Zn binuclear cluster domain containing protein [Coccidioides posadasii C735 delta SOWgp]EER22958.1 Fungal Zn binuclear cluster domain containing protein [Coccidioides posadasii C735 delta SOWgp]|eukprot:XP_003065103.1 Fungal Zn binuclear cluster domain containing protein [Coccidioides posadasii C735 delta SOWgp]